MEFIKYLDEITLTYMFAISQIVVAFVFLMIYPIYQKQYMKIFVLGLVVTAIAQSLFLGNNETWFFFGSVLHIIAYTVINYGFFNMLDSDIDKRLHYILTPVIIVGLIIVTFIYPVEVYRIIIFSIWILALTIQLVCKFIISFRMKKEIVLLGMIAICVGYIATLTTRVVNAVFIEEIICLHRNSNIYKITLLYSTIGGILRGFLILLYNARKILSNEEN